MRTRTAGTNCSPPGEQCGADGLVTFAAGDAGLITTAGVVYDNGAGGAVEVSDLTVAGEPVFFQDPPAPSPSPTAEPSPGPDPSGKPTPAPSDPAAPGQGGGDDKPGLPVTGASVPILVGGGAVLAAAGGGLWWLARRRGVSFTA